MTAGARYEQKLASWELSRDEALVLIRRHRAAFREAFSPRWVNSIYFDSPPLGAYFDHVNGVAERKKTRIRWYGALAGEHTPALEQKLRSGSVGYKRVYPLPALAFAGHVEPGRWDELASAATEPDVVRGALAGLAPTLLTRYHRHYFVSAGGRIRLTLDTGLELYAIRRGAGRLERLPASWPSAIFELKYAPRDVAEAAEITAAFPLRVAKCSKYVLGIGAMLRT